MENFLKVYYIDVLKAYSNFSGRSGRSEFWYFVLINFIISWAIRFLIVSLWGLFHGFYGLWFVSNLYSLFILVPSIAIGVRRMHDIGKEGWYIIIPFYNIYLAIQESVKGENEYGPEPAPPTVKL